MFDSAKIDLKLIYRESHTLDSSSERMAYEYRQNDLCSIDGFPSGQRFPKMRQSIWWSSQSQKFHLLGSISFAGLCTTNVSRKLERYSNLSPSRITQTIPYGLPRPGFQKHPGQCQLGSRLAHLCRFLIHSTMIEGKNPKQGRTKR